MTETVSTVVLLETQEGRALVETICSAKGVPMDIFEELIAEEIDQQGRGRRHGLYSRYDELLAPIVDEDVKA